VTRLARCEADDTLEEGAFVLRAGAAGEGRGDDGREFFFAELALAGNAALEAERAEHDAGRALDDEAHRQEDDEDEAERTREEERDLLGAVERDELGDLFAEEHVEVRDHREGDARADGVRATAEDLAGRGEPRVLDDPGKGGLADPAEGEGAERDSDLRGGEVAIDFARDFQGGGGPGDALLLEAFELRGADPHHREFGGDEEAVEGDQRKRGEEAQHRGAQRIMLW
jgi:hypothetical protein